MPLRFTTRKPLHKSAAFLLPKLVFNNI